MSVVIKQVEAGSIGQRLGFQAGDVITAMNGRPVDDVLDYRFHLTNTRIQLEGATQAGETFRREARKSEYDDLGLDFDTYLMDKQRSCRNKCVFCFIDQLPPGMRESLYFKDDDSRMSFLFGNYITLTNLEEKDVRRILEMHISPVNVSVHTMNPRLRVRMMKNPRAGAVLEYLPRLAAGNIKINAQLVLCPGINDGPELEQSLRELCALAPQVQSVAVVPVGLTAHREGLDELRLFQTQEAKAVLEAVNRYGEEMLRLHGQRVCFAADEFYLAAGEGIPPAAHYEEYPQLENGVGLLALLQDEFAAALKADEAREIKRRVTLATGVAAAPFLSAMAEKAMEQHHGLFITVKPIENRFFGSTITVAGLVTGGDLLDQMQEETLGEELLFPAVMLRSEGDLFLDNVSVDELSRKLGVPVRPVPNDGYELLDALLGVRW